ncbi:MAG: tRNA guanosine(34) transglycosylase Tgt [Treponema sp.]|jgi:queuine tRNA-ribosyltransferase|nr:tRNA guanosine(34) transglycosylase Tgt [Treponema sp.]
MLDFEFSISHSDSSCAARAGMVTLPHGTVSTPVFMPVGTSGTVKAMTVEDLKEIGFEIILSNTYHLYLRPGMEVMSGAQGLHHFMNWDRNILTDSGGFQVFSLSALRKVLPEGVWFQSHVDGSRHFLDPEKVVDIQRIIGSDIQMQLDVCTGWGSSRTEAEKALNISSGWLSRAKDAWTAARQDGYRGSLFGIMQGNFFPDLRQRSAEACIAADTPGIAIGGLSVGEPADVFAETLSRSAALLPPEKPRYVMGIGTPEYILEAIENGIDMFDCVLPTREARNGRVYTASGPFALKKSENTLDFLPIDTKCGCKVCRNYSRAYLRHLFKTQEILCSMLASYHNLYFLNALVTEARRAITGNRFSAFKRAFLSHYREASNE